MTTISSVGSTSSRNNVPGRRKTPCSALTDLIGRVGKIVKPALMMALLFSGAALVGAALSNNVRLNEKDPLTAQSMQAVCAQIRAPFSVDLTPGPGSRCALGIDTPESPDVLLVSMNVKEGTPTTNLPDYRALVQNVHGKMVPDQSETTIGELKAGGVFTGTLPDNLQVNTRIYCGQGASCNSWVKAFQKTPPGGTVAEANGWTQKETLAQLDHFEDLNPKLYTLRIERNSTQIGPFTPPANAGAGWNTTHPEL